MENINPKTVKNQCFASYPKLPTQMGLVKVYNSVTNIFCFGTFKVSNLCYHLPLLWYCQILSQLARTYQNRNNY